MTTIPTPTSIDAPTLHRVYSSRDADLLASLYADDAVVEIVDAQHTPSRPQRLEGREAIARHHAGIFGRDLRHDVEHVAIGDGTVAYSVRCAYPDGTRVVCVTTAALQDGRIAEQIVVQAWD
jgi:ketosteroid isomerase-like protein